MCRNYTAMPGWITHKENQGICIEGDYSRRKKSSLLPRRRPSPDDVVSTATSPEHLRPTRDYYIADTWRDWSSELHLP
jgi:hypothetical protein